MIYVTEIPEEEKKGGSTGKYSEEIVAKNFQM